jgi:hypothetical protein
MIDKNPFTRSTSHNRYRNARHINHLSPLLTNAEAFIKPFYFFTI